MNTEKDDTVAQPQRPTPNLAGRIEERLQSKTLAGLMQLVPLLVTVFLIAFIVGHADSFVRPLPYISGRPWDFPGIGLIAIIVIFYLVGLLISTAVGRRIMGWKSAVLRHIPVIKTIFGATEQMTTLMASDFHFSRVVFLEWPREGMVAMGFVTGRAYSQSGDHSLAIVYIPTVPNPTSGNTAFVNEDDLLETDITVEDAVKLIFSGGIILPEKMALARRGKASSSAALKPIPNERNTTGRQPKRFVSSAFHKSPPPPCVASNGVRHQAAMCRLQPRGAAGSHLPTGRWMRVEASLPTKIVGYNWALVAQQIMEHQLQEVPYEPSAT